LSRKAARHGHESEELLLKKRLSTPRAATVIVLAAVVALSVTVAPSIAASFLTPQAASKTYVTNQKAAKTYVTKASANAKAANYLTKKAAANTYVAKKTAPLSPVVGIAAGTALYSVSTITPGYIPTAFTSFATKTNASSAVITFSGTASCTNGSTTKAPTADQNCPVQILVDGQSTGKVPFAAATLEGPSATKPAAALTHTISQTTVLGKGGHTIAVQYAGASGLNFALKTWNLSVQAYPQPEEVEETAPPSTK
jgi:hypothetical protein